MMGEKLKRYMDERKVSQAELARVAGVTEAFVSYLVAGKKTPSVPVLKRISEHLGVPMDELV